MEKKKLFCLRYAFQAALYALWRERNKLKHEDKLMPMEVLKKMIHKGVRNKLSSVRSKGIRGMEGGLQFWFVQDCE
ncbi:BnaC08g48120D [Brassica napus]|uniref:BnaC08g48120D protein n=2 Tax=Brassica TaxID=3705 RepID=A0A078IU78_BRANA|nr:BnaC08g48120D [Brassica napus]